MVRVGLVGVGFMGQQHFSIYQGMDNVQVVAVCDRDLARVAEQAASIGGNIGDATELDLSQQARYTDFAEMIGAGGLDVVDICTPTHTHADLTCRALEAGLHVICEKPMARTVEECDRMIAAARSSGRLLFIAQCIRFWPEYEVLAQMVSSGALGAVQAARFTRLSAPPGWASEGWLANSRLSGGALLDLHIHDVDFILSLFGKPKAVLARAVNGVDHVVASYLYDDMVCTAEGGWIMPPSFPFEMGYQVLGEKGLLEFSLAKSPSLRFYPREGEPFTPEYQPATGYQNELAYFVSCIESGTAPERVTPESARDSVAMVVAEEQSINSAAVVTL